MITAITALLALILGAAIATVIGIAVVASQLADLKAYTVTVISLLSRITKGGSIYARMGDNTYAPIYTTDDKG